MSQRTFISILSASAICISSDVLHGTDKSWQINAADTLMFLFTRQICLYAAAILSEQLGLPCLPPPIVTNLRILSAQWRRPQQTESPMITIVKATFEAWGWAPVNGLTAAPADAPAAAPSQSGGSGVSRTVSQLRRVDFFRGTMTTRMLRHDDGGVSILHVHGGGPPRRTAYGCTSRVQLRNVYHTCISRLHESKPSCDLWIAARSRVTHLFDGGRLRLQALPPEEEGIHLHSG